MSYLGLRGRALSIVLSIVGATAFALQGYDQAVMNGLVTLPTFLQVFPQMKDAKVEGTQFPSKRELFGNYLEPLAKCENR